MFSKNPYFFYPFFFLLLLSASFFYFFEKGDIVLIINALHDQSWFDQVMRYATRLGEWYFLVVVFFFLLFYDFDSTQKKSFPKFYSDIKTIHSNFSNQKKGKVKLYVDVLSKYVSLKNRIYAFFVLTCFAVSGLGSTFLKRVVFGRVARPKKFFAEELPSEIADTIQLHFVEGVYVNTVHSFPSGHTATAFGVFAALSLLVKQKAWGLLFLFLAVLTGFTRIYLVQHFFVDTYFGAIWGVLCVWGVYFSMKKLGFDLK